MGAHVLRLLCCPCLSPSTPVPPCDAPASVQTPLAMWERIKAGKMGDLKQASGG